MQSNVTLPEGVSLDRVGQILRDAWEVGSHQWRDTPLQLREGAPPPPPAPLPADALDLFRLLHERQVRYLLVGGIAMLTYVSGRNTQDVDLLMSLEALHQVPELEIVEKNELFVRARFRSVRVDLLLTSHPIFKLVNDRFATKHRFAELEVPTAKVEGLIVLKLYALPSLYRQYDWDRVYVYESDIKQLLARYHPEVPSLFELLEPHVMPSDLRELRKMLDEEQQRLSRLKPSGPN
jgi:hypothetical protein